MRPDLRRLVLERLQLTQELPEHALRTEGMPIVNGNIRRQRISYAVPPLPGVANGRLSAWLLRPAVGTGPYPAVIALHPHQDRFHLGGDEVAGVCGQREHQYGATLAARGFQVLCPDLPCFGQQQAPTGFPTDHRWEEHCLSRSLVYGRSLLAESLDQLRCAAAALIDHPQTAGFSIGAVGFGLGARMAAWLAFADSRIGAVWLHAGLGQQAALLASGRLLPRHLLLPGLLDLGLDQADIVADLLPRPVGISYGRLDQVASAAGVEPVVQGLRERADEIPNSRIEIQTGDYDHRFPAEVAQLVGDRMLAWLG